VHYHVNSSVVKIRNTDRAHLENRWQPTHKKTLGMARGGASPWRRWIIEKMPYKDDMKTADSARDINLANRSSRNHAAGTSGFYAILSTCYPQQAGKSAAVRRQPGKSGG
jgi:hypothetical protein